MNSVFVVAFICAYSLQTNGAQEQEALRYSSEAFYKQSGLQDMINNYVNKKVPKELQNVAGNVFLVSKMVQEQKITVSWSF